MQIDAPLLPLILWTPEGGEAQGTAPQEAQQWPGVTKRPSGTLQQQQPRETLTGERERQEGQMGIGSLLNYPWKFGI